MARHPGGHKIVKRNEIGIQPIAPRRGRGVVRRPVVGRTVLKRKIV